MRRSVSAGFADCVLEADQKLGADIFISRPDALPEVLSSEEVCTFLKRYPAALTLYLEHQVLGRRLQVSRRRKNYRGGPTW